MFSPRFREALKREVKRQIQGQQVQESKTYVQWGRDCETWADWIRKGLKKEHKHLVPDRPALCIRTGFGRMHMARIFQGPKAQDYWADSNLFRKAKAFWEKWEGEPAQKLFRDSAKGLLP